MKYRLVIVLSVVAVCWVGVRAGFGAQQTWTGIISDSLCRGDHGGEVDERECTQKCINNGDKYVLVTDYGKRVWPIANQDFPALRDHPGHTVKVTGELQGDAIQIAQIDTP